MMENENKKIAEQYLSAWNAGFEDVVDRLAHPELIVQYTHFGEPVKGVERFKDVLRQTHHYFPDLTIQVDEIIAEGAQVVVAWTYEGTHQQEALFDVQPSGKRVRVSGITVYRITGGKVIEERGIVDNLSLMMQLQGED
jgi:steroid delta-isomerase-like uncharacterized protein